MNKYDIFKKKYSNGDFGYCDPEKKKGMHRAAKALLKQLATDLGLTAGQYDIRSNMGGIAVSGEITLHSDNLYVQIQHAFAFIGMQIMIRPCKGRKDYSGGANNFFHFYHGDYSDLIKKIGYVAAVK